MLNELVEFEEYTYDITNKSDFKRLRKRYIGNGKLIGIARPLIIIARWCIFSEFALCDLDEKIQATKNVLKLWIGNYTEHDMQKEDFKRIHNNYKYLDNWLRKYIISFSENVDIKTVDLNCFDNSILDSKLNAALDSLNNKRDYSIYPSKTSGGKRNDRNSISYESTIAEAMQMGILRKRYLVCKADSDYFLKNVSLFDIKNISEIKKSSLSFEKMNSDLDKILKLTYIYLATYSNRVDKYKKFSVVDYSNWTYDDARMDKLYSNIKVQCRFKYKGYNLFDKKPVIEDNKKNEQILCINQEWLDDLGWQIMDSEELKNAMQNDSNLVFFSDAGSGKYLMLNTFYDEN